VDERKTPSIFVNKGEGRTAHAGRFGEQSCGDASDQGGFACSQLPEQSHNFSSLEKAAQALSQTMCLLGRSKYHAPGFDVRRRYRTPLPGR
jgi:hypothetical protein